MLKANIYYLKNYKIKITIYC